jgi:hypothetical protein
MKYFRITVNYEWTWKKIAAYLKYYASSHLLVLGQSWHTSTRIGESQFGIKMGEIPDASQTGNRCSCSLPPPSTPRPAQTHKHTNTNTLTTASPAGHVTVKVLALDTFRHWRPWIFCRMSSWVVNVLWNDTAFGLYTFLSVYNSEVYVEKKKVHWKTPETLSYIT